MAIFSRNKKTEEKKPEIKQEEVGEVISSEENVDSSVPEAPTENLIAAPAAEEVDISQSEDVQFRSNEFSESPVEQKIHELVEAEISAEISIEPVNGWGNIQTSSRNGMPIYLSEKPDGDGVLGYWKRTRAFHAKRWQETGKWVNFMTGADISFEPKYWRERYSV